jgi:hypothetical protein
MNILSIITYITCEGGEESSSEILRPRADYTLYHTVLIRICVRDMGHIITQKPYFPAEFHESIPAWL